MKIFTVIILFSVCNSALSLDKKFEDEINSRLEEKYARQIIFILQDPEKQGLPMEPLYNKAREGLAKGKQGGKILSAVKIRFKDMQDIKQQTGDQGSVSLQKSLFYLEKKRAPKALDHGKAALDKKVKSAVPQAPTRSLTNNKSRDREIQQKTGKKGKISESSIREAEKKAESMHKRMERKIQKNERKLERENQRRK
jgi:hypothetical protein